MDKFYSYLQIFPPTNELIAPLFQSSPIGLDAGAVAKRGTKPLHNWKEPYE